MKTVKKAVYIFSIFIFCLFATCIGIFCAVIRYHAIDFSALEQYDLGTPSIILDDEGYEWGRFALDKRQPIEYKDIPKSIIDAFCAAEDHYFFEHSGLSYRGIIRSLLVNIYHGKKVQGASTITQQLVKLLFLNNKKTFSRKCKEQLYALFVEQQYTKEHILCLYLNNVCFGNGIYGIEAAAQRFWGISARYVTIDQAATLAGIIRRPEYYCPLYSPLTAQRRRNVILSSLFKKGLINEEQYHQALAKDVVVIEHLADQQGLYLKEMLRVELEAHFGKEVLYTGGLIIQTTIKSALQKAAEKIMFDQCIAFSKKMDMPINGALISLEPRTGEIKAILGGFDYHQSQYNRALAHRQLGSVIKPLIYAAAMERGASFADTEVDESTVFSSHGQPWAPKNYDKKFRGEITLAQALSFSNNIVTIKTLLRIGVDPVIDLLKKAGVTALIHRYPSLALGCIDTTLLEVVGMFNVFANNGMYVKPHYIRWIKNSMGEKVIRHTPQKEKVISSRVTGQVMKVLTHGLKRVRNFMNGPWIDAQAISKTGTTNDSRTCWFVGATPTLTTGVYVGCDDNRSMGDNVYPIKTAFPIWLSLYQTIEHPVKEFSYDPSLKETVINAYTGKPVALGAPGSCTIMQ